MSEARYVFVITQNLFFMPRIRAAADSLGYEVQQTRTESDFWGAFDKNPPELVLVDLEGEPDTWPAILNEAKRKSGDDVVFVAYGPHSDIAGFEKAKTLGCVAVFPKGQFVGNIAKIIKTRGAMDD